MQRRRSLRVVHPQRHPLSGRRTPHRERRRPGLLGLGKQRHVADGHPLARRERPTSATCGIDAVGYDAVIHSIHDSTRRRSCNQIRSSRELTGDVRPAFADLHHAFALPGLRMDDPRPTQTIERRFSVDGADRRHGDRGEKPHRPGPRPQRHRSGTYRGHGTQTRPRRHHDLFALARRAFGQQLRIGAFRQTSPATESPNGGCFTWSLPM